MALINVTPVMTGNTTPSPYKCWASTTYSPSCQVHYLFDNIPYRYWASKSDTTRTTEYVCFDFSKKQLISRFIMKLSSEWHQCPYSVTICGSNDGVQFTTLQSWTNNKWIYGENIFDLDKTACYQIYKFIFTKSDPRWVSVDEIVMYYDERYLTEPLSNTIKSKCIDTISNNPLFQELSIPVEGV